MPNTPTVVFVDKNHKYFRNYQKPNQTEIKSVTTILKKYFPFDRDYWSTYKTIESVDNQFKPEIRKQKFRFPHNIKPPVAFLNRKLQNIPSNVFFKASDSITLKWKDKTAKGTAFHLKQENIHLAKGYMQNLWDHKKYPVIINPHLDKYDNASIIDDYTQLVWGAYLELLVHERWTLGQADGVFIDKNKEFDIIDYKTDPKISKSSYEQAKGVLSHLPNSKYYKFAMQLSIYAFILESYGFTTRKLAVLHHKDFDVNKRKVIELPYLRDEVLAVKQDIENN